MSGIDFLNKIYFYIPINTKINNEHKIDYKVMLEYSYIAVLKLIYHTMNKLIHSVTVLTINGKYWYIFAVYRRQ